MYIYIIVLVFRVMVRICLYSIFFCSTTVNTSNDRVETKKKEEKLCLMSHVGLKDTPHTFDLI